jgi:hypothetical protein
VGGVGGGGIQASFISDLHSIVLFYEADEIRDLKAFSVEYVQDQW